jgi:coenzyme Q-binding protein COQ10
VLVDFEVEFEFKSKLFEMLAGQVFDKALRKMIGAFENRAAELYGAGESGSSSSSAQSAA